MKWFLYLGVIVLNVMVYSQTFTKITGIPPVSDGGDSRAVNWVDYDNDSDLDLYITNGPQNGENNFFYENEGGAFVKKTGIGITEDGRSSDGSSWGDYDNDGHVDVFVANWYNQNNLLYRNNGDKTFTLITTSRVYTDLGYSETGAWSDFNEDGFLDLYVCNSETPFRNFFYMNDGQGAFIKITEGAPATDTERSRNADWADFDNDGDVDLFVANEGNSKNSLYRNNGDASFTKITEGNIVNDLASSFGSSWGDYDNDGDFDLFVANHSGQNNFLYNNNGDGTFTKITEGSIVNDGGYSIGSCWGDVDNDGDLDLFVANGFGPTLLTDFLYMNNGDGSFTRGTSAAAADSGWSYGCSFGDYNNDGWLDLAVAKCYQNQDNTLFKNEGGSNHYIKFNLKGTVSNISAIGSVVKVYANINGNDVVQMQQVTGQSGYCGQNLQLHFGLGDASAVDSILISWPSGIKQKIGASPSNIMLDVEEDETLLGVKDHDVTAPAESRLYQNYPNPFNPSTTIDFFVARSGMVTIKLIDLLGQELYTIVNEQLEKGYHSRVFNASELSSGVYLYTLSNDRFIDSKKLLIMK